MEKTVNKNCAVICFAGDSGDGIQLIGEQLAATIICEGNYVHTFPDFPSEIRAPAGTVRGVSCFQLCFSVNEVLTAGDFIDTLVAFNPAALKAKLPDLESSSVIIADIDQFTEQNIKKAGFVKDPLNSGELKDYKIISIPITNITLSAVKEYKLKHVQARKCKNMFALGLVCHLYNKSIDHSFNWITNKFIKKDIILSNQEALKAGYNYEILSGLYRIPKSNLIPGKYRCITGNKAFALGCLVAASKAQRGMFVAGYPITPATEILQELMTHTDCNVITWQAEDEMAAVTAAIGASFGGTLAMTCTSGPGFDLKAEGIGLAVMAELPLVVIDVQRAGPSTGMPTKSEQSDLLAAVFGRHGECPVVVLAPATPSDCFYVLLEALQIAVKYMVPVIILSDANLANAAEIWRIPDKQDLNILTKSWVCPETLGLTYCKGGLEKDQNGEVSYEPENHNRMVKARAEKVNSVVKDIPAINIIGKPYGRVLIVTWGSTYGVVKTAVCELQNEGCDVALINLRYLNPLPSDLGNVLRSFEKVLIPENNLGQLAYILRANYLIDVQPISKITGKPFMVNELKAVIMEYYE